jgi:hypothetical protein
MRILRFNTQKNQSKHKTPKNSKKKAVAQSSQRALFEEEVGVIVYRATGRMKRKYGI